MKDTLNNFAWARVEPRCVLAALARSLWMAVLAALCCFFAAATILQFCSRDTYGARVTFVVSSHSAVASTSQDLSAANSVAETFTELLNSSTCAGRWNRPLS